MSEQNMSAYGVEDQMTPVVQPSEYPVGRLNQLLDELTAKRFLSPSVFIMAVRGACNLFGMTLPHVDIEGVDGATAISGYAIQVAGADVVQSNINGVGSAIEAPPVDGEYVFIVGDGLYLYMVVDRDEEGLYQCYAQVVDSDELDDLLNMDEFEKYYPELVGDTSGETEYDKTVRHSNGSIDQDEGPTEAG